MAKENAEMRAALSEVKSTIPSAKAKMPGFRKTVRKIQVVTRLTKSFQNAGALKSKARWKSLCQAYAR